MKKELTKQELEALYLPPSDDFTLIEVPRIKYFMLDGQGNPKLPAHAEAIRWLWATVYPIRRIAKERMGKRFIEPPLEGLYWTEDPADFAEGRLDKLSWRLMIPAAEWMDEALLQEAIASAAERLGDPPASLRLEHMQEGLCAQIMHIGPPAGQRASLECLHGEFLPERDLVACGPHHEIYLNDPQRTAPAKLKTVLRQPVRPAS